MRIATLLACIALALAACGDGRPKGDVNIGSAAPAFTAPRLDGTAVEIPGAQAGRPLVIRFWADWCKFCEGEMKAIEAVYQRHRAAGLEVVAVNAGQDRKTVADFMGKIGVTYPALLDEQSAVARRYGVVGLPTTFFVDGQGVVRGKVVGEADEATFERQVRALLP